MIDKAILQINSNAKFTISANKKNFNDVDLCNIEWLENTTPISKEDIEVYGPFEGPVTKVGYKHRMFCIIQSNNKDKMLTELSSFAKSTDGQRKEISSWVIDIDPINAV